MDNLTLYKILYEILLNIFCFKVEKGEVLHNPKD
jgi:hypothetical protein